VPQAPVAFESWCSALAAAAVEAKEADGGAVEVHPRLRRVTAEPAGHWQHKPQAALVTIADGLALLTINAEVVSSLGAELSDRASPTVVIPATCADEVIGYWPTSAMLNEGGYEGCRSRPFYPPVDWEQDDPDTMWRTMLARTLEDAEQDGDPIRSTS
jgi:hypothetical protein